VVDAAVGVEAREEAGLGEFVSPAFDQRLGDVGLGVAERGEGGADGRDVHWRQDYPAGRSRGQGLLVNFHVVKVALR
jgi:hypothetical protein